MGKREYEGGRVKDTGVSALRKCTLIFPMITSIFKRKDLCMHVMIQQSIFHSSLRMILIYLCYASFCKEGILCREILMIINALHIVHADRSHVSLKEECIKCNGQEGCMALPQHFLFSLSILMFFLYLKKFSSYHLTYENSWKGIFYQQTLLEIDKGVELQRETND